MFKLTHEFAAIVNFLNPINGVHCNGKVINERKRYQAFRDSSAKKDGLFTQQQSALLASLSVRQFRRVEDKYLKGGARALLHGNLGKPSPWSDPHKKEAILKHLRAKYKGFGATLAAEMLKEDDKIDISVQAVWRYIFDEGLWPKPKKKKKHRSWRPPKEYYGQMIQLDGSEHDWFEGRGTRATLLKFIDDATSRVIWLQFVASESLDCVMQTMRSYVETRGRPLLIYTDRGKVFKVNYYNQYNEYITQFERILMELDIEIIHAHSAPAKGRVERGFETDQDRLVKLMRLKGISTIEEAYEFITHQQNRPLCLICIEPGHHVATFFQLYY